MSSPAEQRKLAAIMFTDMVGYSALSQRDEKLAQELLEEHRRLLREIFPRFNGTEIKTIGDAFLVEFNSALEAAQCAIEIQRALAKRNADISPDRRIELKIGIHIGDVVHRGGDVYGDGVNIASRIEPLAGAGGICVSMDVERQIRNAVETRFEKLATTELKNISVPMELFRIVLPWERTSDVRSEIRRGEEQKSEVRKSSTISTSRKSAVIGALTLLVIIGIGWWWTTHNLVGTDRRAVRSDKNESTPRQSEAATIPEKSIAVLPFENLSRDPDNAYFADGIQDEILTRLSKIADLKVISRTSTQHYKSAPENLPEIARQLSVAHVVEGSVQKSGDAVRVNVQLIKAGNDSHLWADTYDRKLTDVFSVESEIAKAIAEQLQAKLSGREEEVIAAKPTDNLEAYDAYLRGLAYTLKTAQIMANALNAQKCLKEAVRLDPKFALGWALLSQIDAGGYNTATLQPTAALRAEAEQAAETALTLQPKLGEGFLAKGNYYYGCLKDYDTAVRYFEQARQFIPNSSRIPESLAYIARRRNQWDQSEGYFKEAERLDPRNVNVLTQHALSYMSLRQLSDALRKLDQVLEITPDDADTIAYKGGVALGEGDLPKAWALLAPLHVSAADNIVMRIKIYGAILRRQSKEIIGPLQEILRNPDPSLAYAHAELRFWLGWAQDVDGDRAAAQESWRQADSELELFLKDQPNNYRLLNLLALTNMALGNKAAAVTMVERAMAAVPLEKDSLAGPQAIEVLARVCAVTGNPERAIAALRQLQSLKAGSAALAVPLTPAVLRLDPTFDSLRNDPRFQRLCQEPQ
jgi:TolB-like protein/class 3 adenylate cyclase/Tfp pilus assembly protein PilF